MRVAVTARGNPNVRVDHFRDSALPEPNNQNLQNLLRVIRVIGGSFVVRQERAIHESHELHELHELDHSSCVVHIFRGQQSLSTADHCHETLIRNFTSVRRVETR